MSFYWWSLLRHARTVLKFFILSQFYVIYQVRYLHHHRSHEMLPYHHHWSVSSALTHLSWWHYPIAQDGTCPINWMNWSAGLLVDLLSTLVKKNKVAWSELWQPGWEHGPSWHCSQPLLLLYEQIARLVKNLLRSTMGGTLVALLAHTFGILSLPYPALHWHHLWMSWSLWVLVPWRVKDVYVTSGVAWQILCRACVTRQTCT